MSKFGNVDDFERRPGTPSAEQEGISESEFHAMCVAIGTMPAECRKAFVLRKVYRYSYREIAKACGVSLDAAKNHAETGLKRVPSRSD